jgi:hypothetical protein
LLLGGFGFRRCRIPGCPQVWVFGIADLGFLVGIRWLTPISGWHQVLLTADSWLPADDENAALAGDFKRVASCAKSV